MHVWSSKRSGKGHQLTLLFHVDLQTLFEATGLALITSRDVHDTVAIFFANIIQIPVMQEINYEKVCVQSVFDYLHGS